MNRKEIEEMIANGETLTVEFKSDRGPLNDTELLDTVVCLANGQGGMLLIGVEDDGTITGLHRKHRTRPELLAAFIGNRTVPPLSVRVAFEKLGSGTQERLVAFIEVPASLQPIATSDGRVLVRYLNTRGAPGCRPFYPHELPGWHADRGQLDVSAQPVAEATWDDFDLVEFARLRRMIQEYHGDESLLDLNDVEMARALGLVVTRGTELVPTMAGLLLVGQENALRTFIPAHEVAFQVLRDTDVQVNEFYRWPLLRILERVLQAFEIRNEERELNIDLFRVGVPAYDRRTFREAVNNALLHRDYRRLGAIHIQLYGNQIVISNPGGFVEGIRPDNLLVVDPRPRNPRLADCFKRIGLVERTGRGVSIIYKGQLRNGHPPPSYELSSETSVNIRIYGGSANLEFVRLILNEEKRLKRPFNVSQLLILDSIYRTRQVDMGSLPTLIQRPESETRATLEELVEAGVLEPLGSGSDRTYHFSASVYRGFGTPEAYVRTRNVEPLSIEETILQYVRAHGQIARRDVMQLCRLTAGQARYRLQKMTKYGKLIRLGKGSATIYKEPQ